MSFTVEKLDVMQLNSHLTGLVTLLQDTVDQGASIGFLPPLAADMATAYWQGVFEAVQQGSLLLWVARQGAEVVGSVQLALATKPNAPHRAEVQKLMVLQRARRQGIARALMQHMEATAREQKRTLLVLDTRQGDHAESLYRQMGYIEAGVIPFFVINGEGQLESTVVFYKYSPV